MVDAHRQPASRTRDDKIVDAGDLLRLSLHVPEEHGDISCLGDAHLFKRRHALLLQLGQHGLHLRVERHRCTLSLTL
jgi:hypothetical protein